MCALITVTPLFIVVAVVVAVVDTVADIAFATVVGTALVIVSLPVIGVPTRCCLWFKQLYKSCFYIQPHGGRYSQFYSRRWSCRCRCTRADHSHLNLPSKQHSIKQGKLSQEAQDNLAQHHSVRLKCFCPAQPLPSGTAHDQSVAVRHHLAQHNSIQLRLWEVQDSLCPAPQHVTIMKP